MTAFARTALTDFDFANAIYIRAQVDAWTVDAFGNKTAFRANLFADLTSSTLLSNPQILDGNGQWQQPVYIADAVILTVTGVDGVPDHQTGVISANLAGTSAADAAASAGAAQASFGMAATIFERVRTLYNKIKAQALPTSLVALNMLRVNAGATAYELRTVAQVRGDIGLPAAIGTNNYLKSNGGGTAYAEQTVPQVRADMGLPSAASSTAGLSLVATGSGGYVEAGPLVSFRNRIINADHRIDQRLIGGALTLTGSWLYGVDRWGALAAGSTVATMVRNSTATTALTGFESSLRIQRTAADTHVGAILFGQIVETHNCSDLQGQPVTLSFWARCGANFSAAGSQISAALITGTGTDEGNAGFTGGTWTGLAAPINQPVTLTTAWQRFQITATVGATVFEMGVRFTFTPTGIAGANDFVDIAGVQLELGSVALPFERRAFGAELALCQRYFQKSFTQSTLPAQNAGGLTGEFAVGGVVAGALTTFGFITFPVTMRTTPTVTFFNPSAANAQVRDQTNTLDCSATAANPAYDRGIRLTFTGNAGSTAGACFAVHYTAAAEL